MKSATRPARRAHKPADDAAGRILKAMQFAAKVHARNHSDNAPRLPYINHPIAVANALRYEGLVTDNIGLTAAILHDAVEKAGVNEEQLDDAFGHRVTRIVMELTDEPGLSEATRRWYQIEKAPKLSRQAKLIKLADKLCNLRDIVAARRRKQHSTHDTTAYFEWCANVVDGLRGVNPALEAAFDEICAAGLSSSM